MAHIPQEIRAKRGDQVLPKWRALIKFLEDALQVNLGPGIRERKIGDGGRYIWAASNIKSFAYPFKVSASATEARVSEGTVNGVFPYIEDVRINGLDDDDNPVPVPPIRIEHSGVSRSYIALAVITSELGDVVLEDDPEKLKIVHVDEIDPKFVEGGVPIDEDGVGLYPLAVIYWKSQGVIRKTFQITHHNLNHRYTPGNNSQGFLGRHFFSAA